MRVNLIQSTTTNTPDEIKTIHHLAKLWAEDNYVHPTKGGAFICSSAHGLTILAQWLTKQGAPAYVEEFADDHKNKVGVIIDIEETPELTKLLLMES